MNGKFKALLAVAIVLCSDHPAVAGPFDSYLNTRPSIVNAKAIQENPQAYCNDLIAKKTQGNAGSTASGSKYSSTNNNVGSANSTSKSASADNSSRNRETNTSGGGSFMGIGVKGSHSYKDASGRSHTESKDSMAANTWDRTRANSGEGSNSSQWNVTSETGIAVGKDCTAVMGAHGQIETATVKVAGDVQINQQDNQTKLEISRGQEETNRLALEAKKAVAAEERRSKFLGDLTKW